MPDPVKQVGMQNKLYKYELSCTTRVQAKLL